MKSMQQTEGQHGESVSIVRMGILLILLVLAIVLRYLLTGQWFHPTGL